jgi:hypothetical protein
MTAEKAMFTRRGFISLTQGGVRPLPIELVEPLQSYCWVFRRWFREEDDSVGEQAQVVVIRSTTPITVEGLRAALAIQCPNDWREYLFVGLPADSIAALDSWEPMVTGCWTSADFDEAPHWYEWWSQELCCEVNGDATYPLRRAVPA